MLRTLTLLAAITLMLLITIYPRVLSGADGAHIGHAVLMPLMWSLSAGFVYGVGFVPRNPILRMALGPWVAWAGFAVAFAYALRHFLE